MEIVKSSVGEGFVLKIQTEVGLSCSKFTGLNVCCHDDTTPEVMLGSVHKQTLFLMDPASFWQMVEELNVPVVQVPLQHDREVTPTEIAA